MEPMKVDGLRAYRVSIPMTRPFRISVGEIREKEFVVFEVRVNGVTGWGEAAVDAIPFYTYETVDTAIALARGVFAGLLRSRTWDHPSDFSDACVAYRGHPFTKAALEAALWDAYGKLLGKSVAELVCGDEAPQRVVETGPSLGIEPSPEALAAAVGRELEKGFRRIKVKVAPGRDVTYLAAVRDSYPDATLMVDANAGYGPEDVEHLVSWDRFGLLMIEQPLPLDDVYYHAQLAARMTTPICLDESVESVHQARCVVEMGAADIVNIKVGRVGGLTHTRAVHDVCQAAGIPVWIGSRIGSSIANSVRIAAASLPNATYPTDASFSSRYLSDDLVQCPFRVCDGHLIEVPSGPGLGIEIDRAKLSRYTLLEESL